MKQQPQPQWPIGTRFLINYKGSKEVHVVREAFTPSTRLLHYRNTATGDSGVTVQELCIRLKTPIRVNK